MRSRSEEHTSELQSHRDLHSFPTRRSSDLTPIPNVVKRSWPNWSTFGVLLPRSTSMICCAPNEKPLACSQRNMHDISFRAASVPSHSCGGVMQLSQLSQGLLGSSK